MSDVKFESRCKDCKNNPCNHNETLNCIFYNYKNFNKDFRQNSNSLREKTNFKQISKGD